VPNRKRGGGVCGGRTQHEIRPGFSVGLKRKTPKVAAREKAFNVGGKGEEEKKRNSHAMSGKEAVLHARKG